MSAKQMLNETVETPACNQSSSSVDAVLVDKLPIFINGSEKYASGLTKRTTVDDVKYAMLSVSEPQFQIEQLNDYGIFEKWQGNERILDGKIKIYKLIRLWKSLPGDQLSQVKFIIKKRKQTPPTNANIMKLSTRDSNIAEQQQQQHQQQSTKQSKKFAFCTFSPAMDKTWNYEKAKRKSSLVKRQLNVAACGQQENTLLSQFTASDSSDCDEYSRDESCNTDSSSSSSSAECNKFAKNSNRYASIKRFNRSRKSTVRRTQQMKKSFIELVNKQNEIIDRQLNNINNENNNISNNNCSSSRSRSKSITKFFRSKSLDKCDKSKLAKLHSKQQQQQQLAADAATANDELDENDIKQAFQLAAASSAESLQMDDKQSKEYSKLCKDYLKLQLSLNSKLQRIDDLKQELDEFSQCDQLDLTQSKRLNKSIMKTNKKLQTSIDTTQMQSTKLNDLSGALSRIDDIISLKEKFIQSLEKELQRLDSSAKLNELSEQTEETQPKKSLAYTSESASSSTSSVLTSISQQQPQGTFTKISPKLNMSSSKYQQLPAYTTSGDNESDTGISSANSDDFNSHLETLV